MDSIRFHGIGPDQVRQAAAPSGLGGSHAMLAGSSTTEPMADSLSGLRYDQQATSKPAGSRVMRLLVLCSMCTLIAMPSGESVAQSAEEILARNLEREMAALQGIRSMTLRTETMGMTLIEFFEKVSFQDPASGATLSILRNVPVTEITSRQSPQTGLSQASPAELRSIAGKLEEAGAEAQEAMELEMQGAGLPGGLGEMLLNPPPDQPWLSANPKDITGMYALMLRGAAAGKEMQAAEDAAARGDAQDRQRMAASMQVAGEVTIDGRRAFDLLASNLNRREATDNGEFTLHSARLAMDAAEYVPLRLAMEGTLRDGGETRAVTIERIEQDYRKVAGCGDLYRPFRTVLRMSGMMNAEQQAEMKEAGAQLAAAETQMQSLPAAQREMMMRRLGPQMEMMRKMAAGGGIEIVSNVLELQCNGDMPTPMELAQATFGGGGMQGFGSVGLENMAVPPAGTSVKPVARPSPPARDPEALKAAQQACLQEKMAAAQAASKKQKGFGLVMNAVKRTAARLGNFDLVRSVDDVYDAGATAQDLSAAARELGLTEGEVAACQNPP